MMLRFILCLLTCISVVSAATSVVCIALKTYGLNNTISMPLMVIAFIFQLLLAAVLLTAATSLPKGK